MSDRQTDRQTERETGRLTDRHVYLESYTINSTLISAAWLAQLVERQSAVREVEGSSPRPDQHSGS